jgi:plasmid rolling circle replication initiator protein Rep
MLLDARVASWSPSEHKSSATGRQEPSDNPSVEWLSDTSPRDRPWDRHGTSSLLIADLYRQSPDKPHRRLGDRVEQCSPILEFGLTINPETGEVGYRLYHAYFCRVRFCPKCQWRRGLRWHARMFEALPMIEEAFPRHRWLFLTLTVKNPELDQLKATIKAMRYGWKKMVGYKEWPGVGAVRSVEVTKGKDGKPHPHMHALVLVPGGYFSAQGGYLRHERWVDMWRRAMKLPYDPVVNIKPVKARPEDENPMHGAIAELLKYSVKPDYLTHDKEWLWAITDQLRGSRAVEVFGGLRPFFAEDDDEESDDLVHVSEDGAEQKTNEGGVYFNYYRPHKKYGRPRDNPA